MGGRCLCLAVPQTQVSPAKKPAKKQAKKQAKKTASGSEEKTHSIVRNISSGR
jgi:hypothetical protein